MRKLTAGNRQRRAPRGNYKSIQKGRLDVSKHSSQKIRNTRSAKTRHSRVVEQRPQHGHMDVQMNRKENAGSYK
jgi:hypothetical protein